MARGVSFDYYSGVYGGSAVGEADWARLSQLASGHLARLKALATVTPYGDQGECEAMATCAMAEALQAWEEDSSGITSEHIGSVSVSYGSAPETKSRGLSGALLDAAKPWLHVCLVVA